MPFTLLVVFVLLAWLIPHQSVEFGLQAFLVLYQCLFEQLALLGRHALAVRSELPALQPLQLKGDLLDLGVLVLDRLGTLLKGCLLALQYFGLLVDVRQ